MLITKAALTEIKVKTDYDSIGQEIQEGGMALAAESDPRNAKDIRDSVALLKNNAGKASKDAYIREAPMPEKTPIQTCP